MRTTAFLLLLASLLGPPSAASAEDLEAVYATKNWAQVLLLADQGEASPEKDFWAARALRNMGRHEQARERYLRVVQAEPEHARAADAAIEAAIMLVSELQQVAHDAVERELAERAARELEQVAARYQKDAAKMARASYIAGNSWRIAERDDLAAAAYLRAERSGDATYAAKSLEQHGELAFRGLDPEAARALWQACIERHGRSSAARGAREAQARLAVVGKPAPDFETELWAKGPPQTREDLLGKVTLIYSFATWCPHCQRELPHAGELLELNRERGFRVVGLTANRKTQTTADVFPFVQDPRYRMSYPVAVDLDGQTTGALSLAGLPSVALIDRSGIVRWVGHPNYLSRAAIEQLLAEPAPKPPSEG